MRKYAETGDAVVAGVQRSSANRKEEAAFYINVALVPVPWLRWLRKSAEPDRLQDPDYSEGALFSRAQCPYSPSWLTPQQRLSVLYQAPELRRAVAEAGR